ncbi:hypothetical protein RUND412_008691 [Rhizina undulata]
MLCMEEILAFGKEFRKKNCNWLELWYRVEAFAFYLNSADDALLYCDDPDRIYNALTLVGAMVFSTISKAPSIGNGIGRGKINADIINGDHSYGSTFNPDGVRLLDSNDKIPNVQKAGYE